MQRHALAVCIAGLTPLSASAQEIPTLDEIVVTATRTPTPLQHTLTSTRVLTRADITRRQSQSLADLLAGEAGLNFVNNGGLGKSTQIVMRGAEPDHVVVLIDGVKIGSATTGQAALQDLPLADIERIEIVPGPNSALYGSEAIGGVIQIFTRKGGGQTGMSAKAGLGRYGTRHAEAGLSGGGEHGWFSVSARHFHSDGFSVQNGTETDADGYRNLSLALRGGREFAPGSAVDFTWLRAAGDNEFDGTAQNEAETVQSVLGASLRHRINDLWRTRLQWGMSRDESDNFLNGVFKSRFNTRRHSAGWQNDLSLGATTLTLGLDWQDDTVESNTAYTVKTRDNTGVYAQLQAGVGAHDFRLALRHDDNSQFGGHSTGNAAWGLAFNESLRGHIGIGTAFKAPTFNELYYPGFGNPALQPEESQSLELGLKGQTGAHRWSATLFENQIDNLIGFDGVTNPSNASARIRGLETTLQTRLAGWDLRAALTLQDPENRANSANQGKLLNRRAETSARLDLDRDFGPWRLGATLRGEGRRYDNLANTVKLAGYGLVDLRGEVRLAQDWRLQTRVENLFDKRYETAAGYNQPGAGVYVSLLWQAEK